MSDVTVCNGCGFSRGVHKDGCAFSFDSRQFPGRVECLPTCSDRLHSRDCPILRVNAARAAAETSAAVTEAFTTEQPDSLINHPKHYMLGGIEVIDAIEAWALGFNLGNAVKYIARSAHKGTQLQDLQKARWYLDREIDRLERVK